ncbi:MAG: transcriptional repressor, partial [Elusimicrobia bacterium]|nr:transcriptional repressor [Elusimicrobiota bacterium]
ELEAVCRRERIPLTVQRRAILEALSVRIDHPSIDQMYEDVRDRIPGVSRATVYRVLETLARLGVIRKAGHVGSSIRFDPNTHRHHHMVCTVCDRIADVEAPVLNELPIPDLKRTGFAISSYSVHILGICSECRKTPQNKS